MVNGIKHHAFSSDDFVNFGSVAIFNGNVGDLAVFSIDSAESVELRVCSAPDLRYRTLFDCF